MANWRSGSAGDAAKALEPVAGGAAKAVFAAGFVGAGMLAVPVLAGAGSAGLAGFLGRDWGFSRSIRQAPVFYGLVGAGTATGMCLSLLGTDPIKLLVTAATINGLASAPLLAVVMIISGDRRLLDAHRAGRLVRGLAWFAAVVMGGAALGVVVASV